MSNTAQPNGILGGIGRAYLRVSEHTAGGKHGAQLRRERLQRDRERKAEKKREKKEREREKKQLKKEREQERAAERRDRDREQAEQRKAMLQEQAERKREERIAERERREIATAEDRERKSYAGRIRRRPTYSQSGYEDWGGAMANPARRRPKRATRRSARTRRERAVDLIVEGAAGGLVAWGVERAVDSLPLPQGDYSRPLAKAGIGLAVALYGERLPFVSPDAARVAGLIIIGAAAVEGYRAMLNQSSLTPGPVAPELTSATPAALALAPAPVTPAPTYGSWQQYGAWGEGYQH